MAPNHEETKLIYTSHLAHLHIKVQATNNHLKRQKAKHCRIECWPDQATLSLRCPCMDNDIAPSETQVSPPTGQSTGFPETQETDSKTGF